MEAQCFLIFSIIFCIADLTLPSVVRDIVLTQSWNLGIQRFLVSRYFDCTDQSWADPEQVFKVLPGTFTFSSSLLLTAPMLLPGFRHLFILKFTKTQSSYRAIQSEWNTNTKTQRVLSTLQLSVQWLTCILGEGQKKQATNLQFLAWAQEEFWAPIK